MVEGSWSWRGEREGREEGKEGREVREVKRGKYIGRSY